MKNLMVIETNIQTVVNNLRPSTVVNLVDDSYTSAFLTYDRLTLGLDTAFCLLRRPMISWFSFSFAMSITERPFCQMKRQKQSVVKILRFSYWLFM